MVKKKRYMDALDRNLAKSVAVINIAFAAPLLILIIFHKVVFQSPIQRTHYLWGSIGTLVIAAVLFFIVFKTREKNNNQGYSSCLYE